MFSAFSKFMSNIKDTIKANQNEQSNESIVFNPLSNISRNCVIYIRVSTVEQNTEAQQDKCEDFCFNHRLFIKEIVIEKCSAYKCQSQKGLQKIIEENKDINLVVYSIDRFSRNILKANELINSMSKNRINLISVKENISLNTAFGKHEFRKLVSASQLEAELISERVKNSVSYRQKNGFYVGQAPYGYTVFNKKLARDSDEQLIIKFILTTIKKKTTSEKLSNNIMKLLKSLKMQNAIDNFCPLIITLEDDNYEYRQLNNNEVFVPTFKSLSEILNDYGIKKRNKLWTVSSLNYLVKQQLKNNQREIENMRV